MNIEINNIFLHESDPNTLIAVVNVDGLPGETHPISIPIAALDTRKAIYDLSSDEEALAAIVREVGFSLNEAMHDSKRKELMRPVEDGQGNKLDYTNQPLPKKLKPQGKERFHHLGGLHSEIKTSVHTDAKSDHEKLMTKLKKRKPAFDESFIKELRERSRQPSDTKSVVDTADIPKKAPQPKDLKLPDPGKSQITHNKKTRNKDQ